MILPRHGVIHLPFEDWNDVANFLALHEIPVEPELGLELERLRRLPFARRTADRGADCTCGQTSTGGALLPCLIHDQLPLPEVS